MAFSPKFKEALDAVQKASEISEAAAREEFVKQMVALGPTERIQNLYRIRNKLTNKYTQFNLNSEQVLFITTKSGRDIILKSRQVGFTTYACVEAFDAAIWDRLPCGIMAHKQETVKTIFEIVKQCNQWFKKDWGHLYAPEEENNNTTRLSWKDLRSSIMVAFEFQGYTLQKLHVSEAAFIDPDRLINSFQAVPEGGSIVLESTPDGAGGFFYEVWQDWKAHGIGAPFKGHFVRWFDHYPERPQNWSLDPAYPLSEKERELLEKFALKPYHIAWRRYQIRATCGGSEEAFDRQYPTDDISCFYSGENCVYSSSILENQKRFVCEPSFIGDLVLDNKKVVFNKNSKGSLSVWALPDPSAVYAIGADPAGGVGKDSSVACVINAHTGDQVAELAGFYDPDLFADELYKLGHLYNRAFICPEENNHGNTVINKLKAVYPNLYRRQEFNSVVKKMSTLIGFLTSNSTKVTITDNHVGACRDGKFRVRSNALLSEMSTFNQHSSKNNRTFKREARSGCHDDRVIAACLAWEMVRSRPPASGNERFEPDIFTNMRMDPDSGFIDGY